MSGPAAYPRGVTDPVTGAEPLRLTESVLMWADRLADALSLEYPSHHCGVFLPDPEAGMRLVGQRLGDAADPGPHTVGAWSVPLEGSICGRVARTGAPALVADIRHDPDFRNWASCHTRSELAVPVIAGGATVAVINLESRWIGAYAIRDLDRLLAVAAEAAGTFPAPAAVTGFATLRR